MSSNEVTNFMSYYFNLLKNIDRVLLILPICFAVISTVMIGSTAYQGEFIFNKDIKVQIAAYCLGAIALCVVLAFNYKTFENMEKSFMWSPSHFCSPCTFPV